MPVEIYPPGSPYFSNMRGIGPVRLVNPPSGGAAPADPGYDPSQAGLYVPSVGPAGHQVNNPLVGNRCYYARFVAAKAMTITQIRFVVSIAATADDPVDAGILSADMLTLLGSAGSTLGQLNTVGNKALTLTTPVNLVAGIVYYTALAAGPLGGTAAQLIMTNMIGISPLFGPNAPQSEQRYGDSKFPVSTGTANSATNLSPIMALAQ